MGGDERGISTCGGVRSKGALELGEENPQVYTIEVGAITVGMEGGKAAVLGGGEWG